MPFHYEINLEEDPIYIEGFEKGLKEGMQQGIQQGIDIYCKGMVEKCLLLREFSVEKTAYFIDVSIEYVLEIQERLKKEGKL